MFAVHGRNVDVGRVGVHFRKTFCIVCLREVIQLFPKRNGKFIHQLGHVGAAADGFVAHNPAGHNAQGGQICLHNLLNVRALHLDNNRRTGFGAVAARSRVQASPVRLPQRSSRQRCAVEVSKTVRDVS